MSCESTPTVPIASDYEFEFDATRKATTTGETEAATGLSDVSGHFALTRGGDALGSTATTMAERSAKAGRYFGIIDAATLTSELEDYVGRVLWVVFTVGGDPVKSTRVTITADG